MQRWSSEPQFNAFSNKLLINCSCSTFNDPTILFFCSTIPKDSRRSRILPQCRGGEILGEITFASPYKFALRDATQQIYAIRPPLTECTVATNSRMTMKKKVIREWTRRCLPCNTRKLHRHNKAHNSTVDAPMHTSTMYISTWSDRISHHEGTIFSLLARINSLDGIKPSRLSNSHTKNMIPAFLQNLTALCGASKSVIFDCGSRFVHASRLPR